MNFITPYSLLPICDMVYHPYIDVEFEPKDCGIVLCYGLLTSHVKDTLQKLNPHGKYIFITRDNDTAFKNGDDFNIDKYPQVKKWFVTNCDMEDERVDAMPYGIFCSTKEQTEEHVNQINRLLVTEKSIYNKVFGCFTINLDRPEIAKYRVPAKESVFAKTYATWSDRLGVDVYISNIYHHTFTLSPPGGGDDCQRTWESLYLNSYPIVLRRKTYSHFTDMPIAFVNDWSEINEEWLDKQQEIMKTKSVERLDLDYWTNRILNAKRDLL